MFCLPWRMASWELPMNHLNMVDVLLVKRLLSISNGRNNMEQTHIWVTSCKTQLSEFYALPLFEGWYRFPFYQRVIEGPGFGRPGYPNFCDDHPTQNGPYSVINSDIPPSHYRTCIENHDESWHDESWLTACVFVNNILNILNPPCSLVVHCLKSQNCRSLFRLCQASRAV